MSSINQIGGHVGKTMEERIFPPQWQIVLNKNGIRYFMDFVHDNFNIENPLAPSEVKIVQLGHKLFIYYCFMIQSFMIQSTIFQINLPLRT